MAHSKQQINIREAREMMRHPARQVLRSHLMLQRVAKHLNQEDLAKIVGVSRTTIQNIEQNRTQPSVLTALKLAHVLQAPVETLFTIKYELPREAQANWLMRR